MSFPGSAETAVANGVDAGASNQSGKDRLHRQPGRSPAALASRAEGGSKAPEKWP